MKVDWLIVGAGFTGATVAERLATELNQKVLVIDRRFHIGGNAYDYFDAAGLMVHKYGPHIFHTYSKTVWDYLSRFTEWRPYYHHVLAVVEGKKVPLPFNLNSLASLFPDRYARKLEDLLVRTYGYGRKIPILRLRDHSNPDLRWLADYVYQNVFASYTQKQWELTPEQLNESVTARVPVYVSKDNRYFQDTYQAMPRQGYAELFQRMLSHPNIRLLLNCDYREIEGDIQFKRMLFTGPVDAFFDFRHGRLPYRSLRFEVSTLDQDCHQEVGTVNYPNEYDFTRITEQKYLTGQRSSKTTLVTEYPSPFIPGVNEPYYPVPQEANDHTYALYRREIESLSGKVLFAGRLADYKYYNMDQAVARALHVFQNIAAQQSNLGMSHNVVSA